MSSVIDPRAVLHLKNDMAVRIMGHRGEGATDSAFAQNRDVSERRLRLAENTLPSFRQSLRQGANGFELDAIQTKDNKIVCTHIDEVAQHITISYQPPEKYIGRMQLYQVREIPVGVQGSGRIPSLEDTLLMVKHEFPGAEVNIELKGKIGNMEDSPDISPSFCRCVLDVIETTAFPLSDISFSSFSHRYLMEMAQLCPTAKLSVLYDGPRHDGELLYAGAGEDIDRCAQFTVSSLEKTLSYVPSLYGVNPEVSFVTEETLRWLHQRNLKLYCWALHEVCPEGNTPEQMAYGERLVRAVNIAHAVGMKEITFITDHVDQVRSLMLRTFG